MSASETDRVVRPYAPEPTRTDPTAAHMQAEQTTSGQAVSPGITVRVGDVASSPLAQLRGAKAARDELGNQLDRLEEKRNELSSQLQEQPGPTGANKLGLEQRIAEVDKRIADVEKQIATADSRVAALAGVPGAVPPPTPPRPREGPPEEVFVLGGIFMVVCLLPISVAYARRIWRRSSGAITSLPNDLIERLTRLDQAVDSIAVEVERIGEGQRFVTRVMSESGRMIGPGAAQPIDVAARDKSVINRDSR